MIDSYDIIEFATQKIYEHVSSNIINKKDYLLFRCPICGDSQKSQKKKRGYFYKNNDSPSYFCFNCEKRYDAWNFIAQLEHKDPHEVKKEFYLSLKPDKIKETIHNKPIQTVKIIGVEKKEETDYYIPSNWDYIDKYPEAIEYLKKRLIYDAPNFPKKWDLYFNIWNKRIVFTWKRNGKIVYHQERTMNSDEFPKYLFPTGDKDIFNIDNLNLDEFPYIFYFEGMLDCIFVKNGISIGGLSPSDKQKDILYPYNSQAELIYFPDNYWLDNASKQKIMRLATTTPKMKVFKWDKKSPYKDINEEIMKTKDLNKYMDTVFLKNNITTTLRLKVDFSFSR